MSLNEIRDGFSTQLRQQINEGVERLLEQWSAPHADHLSEIRKVFDEHTGPMRERFHCVRCNETLILKHAQTMVGTEIRWTVTSEVWKVGGNPDRNPDILSGSEGGKGEAGVSGRVSGQTQAMNHLLLGCSCMSAGNFHGDNVHYRRRVTIPEGTDLGGWTDDGLPLGLVAGMTLHADIAMRAECDVAARRRDG